MPLYDYKCECGAEFESIRTIEERAQAPCRCSRMAMRAFSPTRTCYFAFREGWWDTLDVEPVYIKSKKHLKEECARRELSSMYLLDG